MLETLGRVIGGIAVVIASFFITLLVLDRTAPIRLEKSMVVPGQAVGYSISVTNKPDVCGLPPTKMVFEGEICNVNGERVSVLWKTFSNVSNSQPSCGDGKSIRWERKSDNLEWNEKFLGSCGRHPIYFEQLPDTFASEDLTAMSVSK